MRQVVICAAKRTPIGAYLGQFSNISAPQLAAIVIRDLLRDTPDAAAQIQQCLLGCVLTAGVGQAPARQALLAAGLSNTIPCVTLNKVCGSAMQAVANGVDAILLGRAQLLLAGGMESMSLAPYLLRGRGKGLRMGHQQLLDHLFYDGLENADDGQLMGCFAERCAEQFGITRQQQDAYAITSTQRLKRALETHRLQAEITPVNGIDTDEQPRKSKLEKIPQLKPAFKRPDGTVTAANSSTISDGAAVLLLADATHANTLGLENLGHIVGHSSFAQAPEDFTTAVPGAVKQLLQQIHWSLTDVDLFEINEAFAVVVLAAMSALSLDHAKVNIHGGACALGHPIGASGCRVIVTLLHALRTHNLHKGIAAVCIGGGEAMAIAVER